jgi:hypothetical protein
MQLRRRTGVIASAAGPKMALDILCYQFFLWRSLSLPAPLRAHQRSGQRADECHGAQYFQSRSDVHCLFTPSKTRLVKIDFSKKYKPRPLPA